MEKKELKKNSNYDQDSDFVLVDENDFQSHQEQKQGYLQGILDAAKVKVTNAYFKFQEQTKRISDLHIDNKNTSILGCNVTSENELKAIYEKLIYFSYRTFDLPISQNGKTFYNDTRSFL